MGRLRQTGGPVGTRFEVSRVVNGFADRRRTAGSPPRRQHATRQCAFSPRGDWLATADLAGLAIWPLSRQSPIVIRQQDLEVPGLAFAPDGSWLASSSMDGTVRLWPLEGDPPPPGRILLELNTWTTGIAVSPDGEQILAGTNGAGTRLLQSDGGFSINLEGFTGQTWGVAFSADGRLAAAAGGRFDPAEQKIRVWDVPSGEEVAVLEVGEPTRPDCLQFTTGDRLLSTSVSGLWQWDIRGGRRDLLYKPEGSVGLFAASADGRRVLVIEDEKSDPLSGKAVFLDLDSGTKTSLERFGNNISAVGIDPAGTLAVTGDRDGEIRVGPLTGEEPHLLLGHESTVWTFAIDPLGRWIASGGNDGTVRLWPMPDLSKAPLHTLPREELIAKLKTLTNLRVVRDEESSTGWKLTHDPFPGGKRCRHGDAVRRRLFFGRSHPRSGDPGGHRRASEVFEVGLDSGRKGLEVSETVVQERVQDIQVHIEIAVHQHVPEARNVAKLAYEIMVEHVEAPELVDGAGVVRDVPPLLAAMWVAMSSAFCAQSWRPRSTTHSSSVSASSSSRETSLRAARTWSDSRRAARWRRMIRTSISPGPTTTSPRTALEHLVWRRSSPAAARNRSGVRGPCPREPWLHEGRVNTDAAVAQDPVVHEAAARG